MGRVHFHAVHARANRRRGGCGAAAGNAQPEDACDCRSSTRSPPCRGRPGTPSSTRRRRLSCAGTSSKRSRRRDARARVRDGSRGISPRIGTDSSWPRRPPTRGAEATATSPATGDGPRPPRARGSPTIRSCPSPCRSRPARGVESSSPPARTASAPSQRSSASPAICADASASAACRSSSRFPAKRKSSSGPASRYASITSSTGGTRGTALRRNSWPASGARIETRSSASAARRASRASRSARCAATSCRNRRENGRRRSTSCTARRCAS